jgi:hypothetical protein
LIAGSLAVHANARSVLAEQAGQYSWTGTCVATGCPTRDGTCPDAPATGCSLLVGDSLLRGSTDADGRFATPGVKAYPDYGVKLYLAAPGCLPRVFLAPVGAIPGRTDLGAIKLNRGYANRTTVEWAGMTQTFASQWPEYLPGDTVRAAFFVENPKSGKLNTVTYPSNCANNYWVGDGGGDTLFAWKLPACVAGFSAANLGPGAMLPFDLPPFKIPDDGKEAGWEMHHAFLGWCEGATSRNPRLDLPIGRIGHSLIRRWPPPLTIGLEDSPAYRLDGRRVQVTRRFR